MSASRAEQPDLSLGERATFNVFAALGSIYCDEDLVLDVPCSYEAAIALTARGTPFDFRVGEEVRLGLKAVLARHDKRRIMYARGTQVMALRVSPPHPHFNRLFAGDMVELDRSMFDRSMFDDLDAEFTEILHGMWMLMNDPGLSMTDIAHRVGFADSSHFTRTSYQFTGHRPPAYAGSRAWRRQHHHRLMRRAAHD